MENLIILSLKYCLLSFVFLTSILGYGKLISIFIPNNFNFNNYKNYFFILGLIIISFFSIPINFFYPLKELTHQKLHNDME